MSVFTPAAVCATQKTRLQTFLIIREKQTRLTFQPGWDPHFSVSVCVCLRACGWSFLTFSFLHLRLTAQFLSTCGKGSAQLWWSRLYRLSFRRVKLNNNSQRSSWVRQTDGHETFNLKNRAKEYPYHEPRGLLNYSEEYFRVSVEKVQESFKTSAFFPLHFRKTMFDIKRLKFYISFVM